MKNLNSFVLNYRGVREEVWDPHSIGCDRDLIKWNRGNMPLT